MTQDQATYENKAPEFLSSSMKCKNHPDKHGGFFAGGEPLCTECYTSKNQRHEKSLTCELLDAAELALSALDELMGDSDLPDDDSREMRACQALTKAISRAKKEGV